MSPNAIGHQTDHILLSSIKYQTYTLANMSVLGCVIASGLKTSTYCFEFKPKDVLFRQYWKSNFSQNGDKKD